MHNLSRVVSVGYLHRSKSITCASRRKRREKRHAYFVRSATLSLPWLGRSKEGSLTFLVGFMLHNIPVVCVRSLFSEDFIFHSWCHGGWTLTLILPPLSFIIVNDPLFQTGPYKITTEMAGLCCSLRSSIKQMTSYSKDMTMEMIEGKGYDARWSLECAVASGHSLIVKDT